MSLSDQLLERFRTKRGQWFAGKRIEEWVLQNTNNTASNARRRLRELVEDGKLKQKEEVRNGVNHAYYMFDLENTTVEPTYKYIHEFDEDRKVMVEKKVLVTK